MDKSRKKLVKIAALLSAGVMLLTGCATQDKVNPPASEVQQATSTSTDNAVPTEDPTEALTSTPTLEATNTPTPTAAVTATPDPVSLLTDTQRNSINMLNWLTYLSRQINAESNNRLYIEEIYSLVVDETDPEMVDEDTQDRLRGIHAFGRLARDTCLVRRLCRSYGGGRRLCRHCRGLRERLRRRRSHRPRRAQRLLFIRPTGVNSFFKQ